MPKYVSQRRVVSRHQNQQAQKVAKQTYAIILITLLIIASVIFVGIPALTKLAIFLGDVRNSSTPIDPTDTIAPATPQLSTPFEATKSAQINLSGFAEPGSTVNLYHQNATADDTISADSGQFEFTHIALDEGLNSFYVTATDQAHNESPKSQLYQVTFDDSSPKLVLNSPTNDAKFFGPSQQTVSITGSTDEDSTVTINDQVAVLDSNFLFTHRLVLKEGENSIHISARDSAGNTSQTDLKLWYYR